MLKISIVESRRERRLILEGKLFAAWLGELKTACEKAGTDLQNRELMIDLKNLTAISHEGENLLLELMNEGVKIHGAGVFAKELVKQLARRMRSDWQAAAGAKK